jgi:hypothetical protein
VDTSVNNTADAFRNANTIALIVAFLTDRFRQRNSDGNEPAVPPLPAPYDSRAGARVVESPSATLNFSGFMR